MSGAGLKFRNLDRITLSSGVATPLSVTPLAIYNCVIVAEADNTGSIYVGDATVSVNKGLPIAPGDSLTLSVEGAERQENRGLRGY